VFRPGPRSTDTPRRASPPSPSFFLLAWLPYAQLPTRPLFLLTSLPVGIARARLPEKPKLASSSSADTKRPNPSPSAGLLHAPPPRRRPWPPLGFHGPRHGDHPRALEPLHRVGKRLTCPPPLYPQPRFDLPGSLRNRPRRILIPNACLSCHQLRLIRRSRDPAAAEAPWAGDLRDVEVSSRARIISYFVAILCLLVCKFGAIRPMLKLQTDLLLLPGLCN
jgi:hypothetical protein